MSKKTYLSEHELRRALLNAPFDKYAEIVLVDLAPSKPEECAGVCAANAYAMIVAALRIFPKEERYYIACQILGEMSRQVLNWALGRRK